jgi:hypothetical protein
VILTAGIGTNAVRRDRQIQDLLFAPDEGFVASDAFEGKRLCKLSLLRLLVAICVGGSRRCATISRLTRLSLRHIILCA